VSEALGEGGLLVAPGDPAALAAALRRWLGDPALRERLRRAARTRRATLRGWDATASVVAGVLADVARPLAEAAR
jgi:glycosyltransferase involved in cell wall biosynthesis